MLIGLKMERGGSTVAIETPNVNYKAKQRLTSILAGIKPPGSLTCCVYVWGSLSTYREGPCSCNLTTASARLSAETGQKGGQVYILP